MNMMVLDMDRFEPIVLYLILINYFIYMGMSRILHCTAISCINVAIDNLPHVGILLRCSQSFKLVHTSTQILIHRVLESNS